MSMIDGQSINFFKIDRKIYFDTLTVFFWPFLQTDNYITIGRQQGVLRQDYSLSLMF